ncbi:MAG: ArsR family transcriptional regulator [Candidatus Krumholzibacteriota bacterium]|nr:ArsR family transcriptional regulator [Candidatus Krumholzibacteriota bacterium]
MNDKRSTVDEMKKTRKVPDGLNAGLKEMRGIRKKILTSLGSEPKTIPAIASETGLKQAEVTYHLMTMRKFNEIEVESMDDMDEYYLYRKTEG